MKEKIIILIVLLLQINLESLLIQSTEKTIQRKSIFLICKIILNSSIYINNKKGFLVTPKNNSLGVTFVQFQINTKVLQKYCGDNG